MGDSVCASPVGGLFLHCHCLRMVLAVKGSFAMMNSNHALDGCGPFANPLLLRRGKGRSLQAEITTPRGLTVTHHDGRSGTTHPVGSRSVGRMPPGMFIWGMTLSVFTSRTKW
jgi:hypothetical protein